jgi:hypothetical protein
VIQKKPTPPAAVSVPAIHPNPRLERLQRESDAGLEELKRLAKENAASGKADLKKLDRMVKENAAWGDAAIEELNADVKELERTAKENAAS